MRVKNLDGLRGLAALVVVMHHHLLTIPWFSERVSENSFSKPGVFVGVNLHNLIEYSPLHVFYAGTEAVTIFFVLSGYVLVFAVKKSDIKNYLRFRLYRLYVPIFGAVCFSFLL
jgi:peptidoglycan/LPS O-acetylase OafA/YrhL